MFLRLMGMEKRAEWEKMALTLSSAIRMAPTATKQLAAIFGDLPNAYKLPWVKNMGRQNFADNANRIHNIFRRLEVLPKGVTGAQIENMVNPKAITDVARQTGFRIPTAGRVLEGIRTGRLWKPKKVGRFFFKRLDPNMVVPGNETWIDKVRKMDLF